MIGFYCIKYVYFYLKFLYEYWKHLKYYRLILWENSFNKFVRILKKHCYLSIARLL